MFLTKFASKKNQASATPIPAYRGPTMSDFWGDSKFHNGKPKMIVIGHRGSGKSNHKNINGDIKHYTNRTSSALQENSIPSFNMAAENGADFVEFDVQVTKDGRPVIFHDDIIIAEDEGLLKRKRISDITYDEFLAIGDKQKIGKAMVRSRCSGAIGRWTVAMHDQKLCNLQEAFKQVNPAVGFNIEVKFDSDTEVPQAELKRVVNAILQDVKNNSKGRKVFYSSFHPDAVELLRKGQSTYPVFFLTDGGSSVYNDSRRNSIEAAIEVCVKNGLQGIVCEVDALMNNPEYVLEAKKLSLSLLTYGDSNNQEEIVLKEERLGVEGVVVDDVEETVKVVKAINSPPI